MSTPSKDRSWTIDGDPFSVDSDDVELLGSALTEAMVILSRIGGAVIIAAERHEIHPGHFVPGKYHFTWKSFMPAKRQPVTEDEGGNDA